MATEDKHMNRSVPLWLVVVISGFAFLGGAIGGILFCGHYAHEPLAPVSSVTIMQGDAGQIKVLEEQVKENPANVRAWTELGNLYFDSDQYEKAIAAYRQSLQLEPRNADVWTDLGIMYRRTGRPREAIEVFDRAITIDPKHENSRFNKGVVLLHDLQDKESAMLAWEGLSRINPFYQLPEGRFVEEVVLSYRMEQEGRKGPEDKRSGETDRPSREDPRSP
jgi:hypothetical protein